MASTYNLALGYEAVNWDLANRANVLFTGGKPTERWINIGFGFDLSARTKFSLLWQISTTTVRASPGSTRSRTPLVRGLRAA